MEHRSVQNAYVSLMDCKTDAFISKSILERPPFGFIHKVAVELLEPFNLYTKEMLQLSKSATKNEKATFLTRTLAFVSFTIAKMPAAEHQSTWINVLLYVSPIKVLAGLEVERTNEFLLQLGVVFRYEKDHIKHEAVDKVKQIGDSELYTFAVQFRAGLIKSQARIRGWLSRKHVPLNVQEIDELRYEDEDLVGQKLYKEFEGYGIYKGIVKSKVNMSLYVVHYPEDDDEEELDATEVRRLIYASKNFRRQAAKSIPKTADRATLRKVTNQSSRELNTPSISENKAKHDGIPWQSQFQSLLEEGKKNDSVASPTLQKLASTTKNDVLLRSMDQGKPVLPKLLVPGGEHEWKKRMKPSNSLNIQTSSQPKASIPKPKPVKQKPVPKPTSAKVNSKSKRDTRRSRHAAAKIPVENILLPDIFSSHVNGKHLSNSTRALIEDVIEKLETHLKRKRLRVVDLFRNTDSDGNGFITQDEMIGALAQLDISLSAKNAKIFIDFIDQDGNGVIDVEEFDQFVRMARRISARKEKLEKELLEQQRAQNAGKGECQYRSLLRYKQRILDLFRVLDTTDEGTVSALQFRAAVGRLQLKHVTPDAVDDLIKKACSEPGKLIIELLRPLLDDKAKQNEFLDTEWLNYFDSSLNRVMKETELHG